METSLCLKPQLPKLQDTLRNSHPKLRMWSVTKSSIFLKCPHLLLSCMRTSWNQGWNLGPHRGCSCAGEWRGNCTEAQGYCPVLMAHMPSSRGQSVTSPPSRSPNRTQGLFHSMADLWKLLPTCSWPTSISSTLLYISSTQPRLAHAKHHLHHFSTSPKAFAKFNCPENNTVSLAWYSDLNPFYLPHYIFIYSSFTEVIK